MYSLNTTSLRFPSTPLVSLVGSVSRHEIPGPGAPRRDDLLFAPRVEA